MSWFLSGRRMTSVRFLSAVKATCSCPQELQNLTSYQIDYSPKVVSVRARNAAALECFFFFFDQFLLEAGWLKFGEL